LRFFLCRLLFLLAGFFFDALCLIAFWVTAGFEGVFPRPVKPDAELKIGVALGTP
jgi:hypothetical protein